jgi:hypothetical protein
MIRFSMSESKLIHAGRLTLLVLCITSCNKKISQNIVSIQSRSDGKSMQIWDQSFRAEQDLIVMEEVTIYPQAYITTTPGCKIVFQKRVNIIGESQVFDPEAKIIFGAGTISEINPSWFGAKGYDNEDDTHAFEKAMSAAFENVGVVSIVIPVGRYFISRTIDCTNQLSDRKAINWVGRGMSNNGVQGASLSWRGEEGGTLLRFMNMGQGIIENIDFTSEPGHHVKYNLELRPFVHAVSIRHCSFSGCSGDESANINLNIEGGDQVSEIHIDECIFNGVSQASEKVSQSAIRGGFANTKNFYIRYCAFDQYERAAVDIYNSDILHVEGCTFANNRLDISCMLCGTYAISNYSEHSRAFFKASFTSNISFTTLINNYFTGQSDDGYVIQDGAGSLILLNNDFGGSDQRSDYNRIRWEQNEFSPIHSVGNFYKNSTQVSTPFFNRSGQPRTVNVFSKGDVGGTNATGRIIISKE